MNASRGEKRKGWTQQGTNGVEGVDRISETKPGGKRDRTDDRRALVDETNKKNYFRFVEGKEREREGPS